MNAVELENITKTFGAHTAVDDLSLAVPQGCVYGFIGPNGSGKTTTLRMIMNIFYPDRVVRGRWSLLDWFDTDGRRFVIAKRNAPNIGDPRGLTEREAQVVTYAALGESGKIIGYRFGLSTSSVSSSLMAAMHKLGVSSQRSSS